MGVELLKHKSLSAIHRDYLEKSQNINVVGCPIVKGVNMLYSYQLLITVT